MIRNIIFDVGQVFLLYYYVPVFDIIAEKYQKTMETVKKAYYSHILDYDRGNLTTDEFVANIAKDLSITMTAEEFWSVYFQHMRINRLLVDDVRKKLYKKFNLYLLSNINDRNESYFREKVGVDMFEKVFFSNHFHTIKPEGRYFQIFLEQTGISPEQSVFTDDKEDNLETARRFGLKTILFQNNKQFFDELKKIAPF